MEEIINISHSFNNLNESYDRKGHDGCGMIIFVRVTDGRRHMRARRWAFGTFFILLNASFACVHDNEMMMNNSYSHLFNLEQV